MANGVDLQQLSNEELLALEQQQQTSQQPDLSQLSDNDLLALEQQTLQQGQQFRQPSTAPDISEKKSPISILKRLKLSFANDEGRERELRNQFKIVEKLPNGKFAVGNTLQDIAPIDPEGIFNDVLGDLADVAGEIPVIAGQILGASGGALLEIPSGPVPTIILGGALGAASGEAVKKGIGKLLGVNTERAETIATDIAISGAFGAVGESLGQGLKFAGRGLSNIAKKGLDKGVRNSANPSKALQNLGKLFKLTASVNPDDVAVAGTYGFSKALAPKYMNPNFSRTLMDKFTKGLIRRNAALGKMVGQGDDWAIRNFGSNKVELRAIGNKLLQGLSNPQVGMVDDLGRLNRSAFVEPGDFKAIRNVLDSFFSKNPKTGQLLSKNLTVKQIIDLKKKASPLLSKYFKSSGKSPLAQRMLAQYTDELTQATASATFPKGVTQLTPELINNNPFIKANRAFGQWKKDIDLLKANGLDVADTKDLKNLIRDGSVVSQKIENFFERFRIKNSSSQQAFAQIADQLPVKFPDGGVNNTIGTLTDELRKFNAAQGFNNANPNFLRLASVGALMGFSVSRDSPEGAIATLVAGFALGTPSGTRQLLRGSSAVKQLLKRATTGFKGVSLKQSDKITTALLSRLLKERQRKKK